MATTIFNDYYKNVSSGAINPSDVNFSAYIVDGAYVPEPTHKRVNVTGKIVTLRQVIINEDISTLSMSEIIEKVKSKLEDAEYENAAAFVVYDIATTELCWHETFDKPRIDGE